MTPKQASILVALVILLVAVGSAVAAGPGRPQTLASASSSPTAAATQGHGNPNKPAKGARQSERAEPSARAKESESPEASESEGVPSAAQIARIVTNLKAAGIAVTADQVTGMATKVGLGGAVRVFVIAHASGKSPDQILAMFQGGKGWGQIVKELGLEISPGLGGIMGYGHVKNPKASARP